MNNVAISVKNYNRYLNLCRGKSVFIYNDNSELEFELDVQSFNFCFKNEILFFSDLGNSTIDMKIKIEYVLCMEFCKFSNQLIINLINGNNIIIDIV